MSKRKILSCPCCSGDAKTFEEHTDNGAPEHWYREYDSYFVQCEECGLMIVSCISMENAIEKWNRRKPIEDMTEQLKNASYWTESAFDEDGYSNDDSEEVIALYKAVDIVRGGME